MNTRGDVAGPALSGERDLIERIRARFTADPAVLPIGIGDDAAVAVPDRGALQVLTTDAMVEGIHFDLRFSSFEDVGYKALAVNVSDIASMGAVPRLALLSLILPERLTNSQFDALLDGFERMVAESKVMLAGGNITRSPGPLLVDVTVVGSVRPRRVLTRSGGTVGDAIYVSGSIGLGAAGLGWLRANARSGAERPDDPELAACVDRYRRPAPRARVGALLGRNRAAGSCMDTSDGVADAVTQIARASGTGARVDAAALPIHPGARRWFASQGLDPVGAALAGGDDYELVFTVPARRRSRLKVVTQQGRGVPLTRIGELTPDPAIVVLRDGVPEPMPQGFVHF